MSQINSGNELVTANLMEKAGIEAGMRVADLGCGNLGVFTLAAAKLIGKSGVSYAVDVLKLALESVAGLAKQEGLDNVKTVWSDLERVGATAIEANSLDVTFIVNTLFQSTHDDLMIQEACRLLKLGGKLVIVDWLRSSTPFGPPQADRPDKENLKKIALAAGLRLTEDFVAGPYHFGLVFVK